MLAYRARNSEVRQSTLTLAGPDRTAFSTTVKGPSPSPGAAASRVVAPPSYTLAKPTKAQAAKRKPNIKDVREGVAPPPLAEGGGVVDPAATGMATPGQDGGLVESEDVPSERREEVRLAEKQRQGRVNDWYAKWHNKCDYPEPPLVDSNDFDKADVPSRTYAMTQQRIEAAQVAESDRAMARWAVLRQNVTEGKIEPFGKDFLVSQ